MSEMSQAALVALSEWIDAGNAHRDPEAVTWGRLAKVTEEGGEVVAAYIGATGQNPRKGQAHVIQDVVDELMDVAITALGAVEHLTGHEGTALAILDAKIVAVASRAGLVTSPAEQEQSNGRAEPALSDLSDYDLPGMWSRSDFL